MAISKAKLPNLQTSARIKNALKKKVEIAAKIRALQADIGKVNVELARAGASSQDIACW